MLSALEFFMEITDRIANSTFIQDISEMFTANETLETEETISDMLLAYEPYVYSLFLIVFSVGMITSIVFFFTYLFTKDSIAKNALAASLSFLLTSAGFLFVVNELEISCFLATTSVPLWFLLSVLCCSVLFPKEEVSFITETEVEKENTETEETETNDEILEEPVPVLTNAVKLN